MAEKPQFALSPYLHLEAGYTQVIDYDAHGNELYHGWAVPRSADVTLPIWRICRFAYTLGNGTLGVSGVYYLTAVQWAGGDELFLNIWNNRVSLIYS